MNNNSSCSTKGRAMYVLRMAFSPRDVLCIVRVYFSIESQRGEVNRIRVCADVQLWKSEGDDETTSYS